MLKKAIQTLPGLYRNIGLTVENDKVKVNFVKFGIFIVIITAIVVILGQANKDNSTSSNQSTNTEQTKEIEKIKYIPNISASDIYLNLEKKGFVREVASGKEWIYKLDQEGYNFTVSIVGDSPQKIIGVKTTFIEYTHTQKPPDSTIKVVFIYILGLINQSPNSKDSIALWLENNMNKDATTNIEGINYSISGTDKPKIFTISTE